MQLRPAFGGHQPAINEQSFTHAAYAAVIAAIVALDEGSCDLPASAVAATAATAAVTAAEAALLLVGAPCYSPFVPP
eukprot:1140646-Prymnesium_polylepis.1